MGGWLGCLVIFYVLCVWCGNKFDVVVVRLLSVYVVGLFGCCVWNGCGVGCWDQGGYVG